MRISDWSSDVCSSDLPATASRHSVISTGTGAAAGRTTRRSKTTINPPIIGHGPTQRIPSAAIGGKSKVVIASAAAQGSSCLAEKFMNLIYDIADGSNGSELLRRDLLAGEFLHLQNELDGVDKIGRASRRERVCQYWEISGGAVPLKKKN